MRNHVILILLASFSLVMGACTITHEFGPFMGKVVDAETGEPIEGAAVLIGFHTKSGSIGGWVYKFADAIETLTDSKGEFRFPPKQINLFRGNAIWDGNCQILIFKPEYGAYPGNSSAYSSWQENQSYYIPENEYVTYYLPKLLTLQERKENLFNIMEPGGTPIEKMPNLERLKNQEYHNVRID